MNANDYEVVEVEGIDDMLAELAEFETTTAVNDDEVVEAESLDDLFAEMDELQMIILIRAQEFERAPSDELCPA